VSLHLELPLFAGVKGQLTDVGDLLGVVGDHRDLRGLAQLHETLDYLDDVGVSERLELCEVLSIQNTP